MELLRWCLNDFMRGKIPWFTPAPVAEGEESKGIEGREGRLGEMPKKRKRDDIESVPDASVAPSSASVQEEDESVSQDEGEFEGFGSGSEESDGDAAADDDEEDMIPLDELSDIDDSESSNGDEDEG